MIFKPAPFIQKTGEKVAWYRLFIRSAAGNNVKVRLSDNQFLGSGEEVDCISWCGKHILEGMPHAVKLDLTLLFKDLWGVFSAQFLGHLQLW